MKKENEMTQLIDHENEEKKWTIKATADIPKNIQEMARDYATWKGITLNDVYALAISNFLVAANPPKRKLRITINKFASDKQFYSVNEVAQKWSVSANVIYDAISRGELKSMRVGSLHRIRKSVVENFEKEQ